MAPTKRNENGTQRDAKGRFTAGNKGGPGRTPLAPDLRNMLLPLGEKSIKALQNVLDNPDAKDADRLRAAEIVMDRLLGKATQPIVADVHKEKEEEPVTLQQMMARVRELVGDG